MAIMGRPGWPSGSKWVGPAFPTPARLTLGDGATPWWGGGAPPLDEGHPQSRHPQISPDLAKGSLEGHSDYTVHFRQGSSYQLPGIWGVCPNPVCVFKILQN